MPRFLSRFLAVLRGGMPLWEIAIRVAFIGVIVLVMIIAGPSTGNTRLVIAGLMFAAIFFRADMLIINFIKRRQGAA